MTSLTHAHNWGVSKNSACPVVTIKRVSRKTPTVKRADEKKLNAILACIQLMKEIECASVL